MKRRTIIQISIGVLVIILTLGGIVLIRQNGYLLSLEGRIENDLKTWNTIRTVEPHVMSYRLPSSWADEIGSSSEGMINRSGRGKIDPKWVPSWKRASLVHTDPRSVEAAPTQFEVSIRNSQTPTPSTAYPTSGNWEDVTIFQTDRGQSGEFKIRSPFGASDVRLFRASITDANKDLIVEFVGTLPQFSGPERNDVAMLSLIQILKTVEF